MKLDTIKVLFRDPDTFALWGIPYEMRPGQQPGDLWRARRDYTPPPPGHYGSKQIDLSDWIWLGTPGWWGSMSKAGQVEAQAFITRAQEADAIPMGPYEWVSLSAFPLKPLTGAA